MSPKRKVCVVITARPSYARVKTALIAINNNPDLELQLVVAGSALLDRYGTAVDYIEKDGFTINEKVFMVLEGENPTSMAKTTGLGILELATVFLNLNPDVVVSIADRFETMATATAATYMNIPLAHIQGGEVTGNIDEKVRHAITKLADIHFASTEKAKERIIKMGEDPEFVFNTGCPSIDLAKQVKENPTLDFNPIEKYGGVGKLTNYKDGYLVVMQHPVTTEYKVARQHILETLEAINELNIPTFWFWPNVDAGSDGTSNGIRSFRETHELHNIKFLKNMEPNDFLKLIYNAQCMVGNSSTGIRECEYLHVPVVNIGTRQTGRERGTNVVDVSYKKEKIIHAIKEQINSSRPDSQALYGDGDAGNSIAQLIASIPLKITKTITF